MTTRPDLEEGYCHWHNHERPCPYCVEEEENADFLAREEEYEEALRRQQEEEEQ